MRVDATNSERFTLAGGYLFLSGSSWPYAVEKISF